MDIKTRIKQQFNENPAGVVAAIGVALTGVAKLVDATSAAQGRRAYAKQVNFRVKNQKR